MALPTFKDDNKSLMLLQSNWSSQLNPLLANPTNQVSILKGVILTAGVNVINHLLGATLQGWFLSDINGAASVYRSAPKSNLTLTLTSNANVTADIAVF